jgi:hypothetical protein
MHKTFRNTLEHLVLMGKPHHSVGPNLKCGPTLYVLCFAALLLYNQISIAGSRHHCGRITAHTGVTDAAASTDAPAQGVHDIVWPDVTHRADSVLPDVARFVLQQERHNRGKKVITMSLYGNNSRYAQGAIDNAVLAARDWPGWTLRFYHGRGVPAQVLRIVRQLGAETVALNATFQSPRACMYWRFFALEDGTATRVIIRDVDARLSQRDHAAVDEWVASGRFFHTLHDHIQHPTPVLGGMWGAVAGFLNPRLLQAWRDSNDDKVAVWSNDQNWLAGVIWPLVKNETLDHASHHCHAYGAAEWRAFPTQRRNDRDFVGNVHIAENGWQGDRGPPECPQRCRRHANWTAC